MKNINLVFLFAIMTLHGAGQDTSLSRTKMMNISLGTFSSMTKGSQVSTSPIISGTMDDYYFENRYNYEADNSASINLGRRIFKKLKHFEIVPMGGLVFGSFQGATAELQTTWDYHKWIISADNQFSFEYQQPYKNVYFSWNVALYKLTNAFRFGLTAFLDKYPNQDLVFDKGITAAILFKQWGFRFYAYNYQIEKRYYWMSVRYNIHVKLANK